jgi:adenylosuccinate synthase
MSNTKLNYLFKPGKITTLLDGTFGSGGKAKMASYVVENSDNWTFACNAFAPQAGHTVVLNDGKKYFYQTLNSCAYRPDRFDKMYIGPGGMIELPAFFRELEENKVPHSKIGISPSTAILQEKDAAFERGEVDLDGRKKKSEGTTMKGSTCHGVGACSTRKILRRKDALYAKDIPELKEFLCDVPNEIITRLQKGESGFGEIAQGFPLSLNHQFFCGYTTSRNVTVPQFLSDMFLPTRYAGPVIINFRTFPIRINSNKFVGKDGKFLTWSEIESGIPCDTIKGNSGPFYPDSKELTWDEVTALSGSKEKIFEITSVTKLPRRVATFSKQSLKESLMFNDTGDDMYVTVNFMNYVDPEVLGKGGDKIILTPKCKEWIKDNIDSVITGTNAKLLLVGTGPTTDNAVLMID